MPELTLHSKTVHIDDTLDLPKDAKIFHIQYINRTTLQILYTTSRITYAEQLNRKHPSRGR